MGEGQRRRAIAPNVASAVLEKNPRRRPSRDWLRAPHLGLVVGSGCSLAEETRHAALVSRPATG